MRLITGNCLLPLFRAKTSYRWKMLSQFALETGDFFFFQSYTDDQSICHWKRLLIVAMLEETGM